MRIGIDLGGTNIASALVDENGTITKRAYAPTRASEGATTIIDGLIHACEVLMEDTEQKPLSIGIGVPGAVNDESGMVVFTPNLPLRDIVITQELHKKYGCPVNLGNDANCAALGETVAGGAKGARDVVMITLGTGLGGGIVLGGKLLTGLGGAASELGHMVIVIGGHECGCGRHGCWETYGSATGLIRTSTEFMDKHKESLMWKLSAGTPEKLNGRMIFDAYRENDPAALLAVGKYTEHLASGIVNIINILDPEMICVGGGISDAWDCISEPLLTRVRQESFFRFLTKSPQTKIVKALLGNDAGIIGAAMLGA